MERIFDIDAVDLEAAMAAQPEHFQRQLRSSTIRGFARLYLLGEAMGGFDIREIQCTSILIKDTLTWAQIDILRSLVWRQQGVDYVVTSIEGCGELVNDYGGEYVESSIEIGFTRKDA
jgi:hypothetical protein